MEKILKIVQEPEFEGTVIRAVDPGPGKLIGVRGPKMSDIGSLVGAASGKLDVGEGFEGLPEGAVEAQKEELRSLGKEKERLQKLIDSIDLETEKLRYMREKKIESIIKKL